MSKAKSPEVVVRLVNDWYGPDGKFRRVSDNPHTVVGRAADELPPSALVQNEDGDFVRQSKQEPKAVKSPEELEAEEDAKAKAGAAAKKTTL